MRKILSNGKKRLDGLTRCGWLGRLRRCTAQSQKQDGEVFLCFYSPEADPRYPLQMPGVFRVIRAQKNPPGEGWVGWGGEIAQKKL